MSSREERRRKEVRRLPPLKRGEPPWDGRPIRCVLCGRSGVAGERSGGEWRCLELGYAGRTELRYVCPAHFPADGAPAEAYAAAYRLVLEALGFRVTADTDVAIRDGGD